MYEVYRLEVGDGNVTEGPFMGNLLTTLGLKILVGSDDPRLSTDNRPGPHDDILLDNQGKNKSLLIAEAIEKGYIFGCESEKQIHEWFPGIDDLRKLYAKELTLTIKKYVVKNVIRFERQVLFEI